MSRSAKLLIVSLLGVLLVAVMTTAMMLVVGPQLNTKHGSTAKPPSTAIPGTIAPNPAYDALAGNDVVGVDFAAYYQANQGTTLIGQAITPELPNGASVTQLYQSALLSITSKAHPTAKPLPIVRQLISVGALVPLALSTTLTYADLAAKATASAWGPAPKTWRAGGNPAQVGIFVALGQQGVMPIGHYIPPSAARFLARHVNWHALTGDPLTEALPVPGNATTQVQAFANVLLIIQGPIVSMRPAGLDWLTIFGRPTLNVIPQTAIHVTTGLQVLGSAAGNPVATFITPFAATLTSNTRWLGNALWYQIRWQNLLIGRNGWVPADFIMFTKPATNGPETVGADALSTQLNDFLNRLGDDVALSVYVPSQQRAYNYNADEPLETASTIKIVILVTLLSQTEAANRGLTSTEQSEAVAMIENSDNDAAQSLYDEEGGNIGIANYMAAIGINDVYLNLNGFGATTVPPTMMITLLEDLRTAAILTPGDCQYVLNLMNNVSSDERMGLGDTAPPGAVVELKDGFGLEDDGLNVVVTVGILTYHGQVYEVSLFTRREQSLQQGIDEVNTICQDIALGLLGQP